MRTFIRLSFVFFLVLTVICSVMIYRAHHLGEAGLQETQTKLTAFTPPPVDESSAALHLAKALTFATLSSHLSPHPHKTAFEGFQHYLTTTYPKVFSTLTVQHFGQYALLMHWPGSDPTLEPILLMAHQDVVPIAQGTDNQWTHPPFAGEISEGFIWGRGALDIKSSLIAMLEMAEWMLEHHLTPKRGIYFYFGDDEEIGGLSASKTADYCLAKNIKFNFVLDEGGLVISDLIPGLPVPTALVAVAEKGYMDINLSTQGKGGHSSMPPQNTAIGRLSRAINRLETNPFPLELGELQRAMFEAMGSRMSFKNRLVLANLWLLSKVVTTRLASNPSIAALLRTTTAPTIFTAGVKANVLPVKASANINFRILPGDTPKSVLQRVRKVIDDSAVTIKVMDAWGPSKISRLESFGFNTIKLAIKTLYNNEVVVTPYLLMGATDSRHFLALTDDVYRFLAYQIEQADIQRFHGTNERISIKNYVRMINFYYLIMNA